jgi:pimeloyl-ACP methyl ester carboxylesterase
MSKFYRSICSVFVVLILTAAKPARAEVTPPQCQTGALASNDPSYPQDQLIYVCVPPGASWNGDLIVYAHGFVPPQEELALPLKELTLPDGTFVPAVFLTQGFAFATSSFHKNGTATEQGMQDLLDLINYFETKIATGPVNRTFIVGASEGGLIALQLIEQHSDQFAAGLALCPPAGGARKQIKYAADFRVVFDYFFPNILPDGAFGVPLDAFTKWDSLYQPAIIAALTGDPIKTLQLFSVTRAAIDPADPASAVETALDVLFYSIFETNDEIATAGGIPYDNRFTLYVGLTNILKLNAAVERIRGDRAAEDYARAFYQTTGKLTKPLVTLHNILDPVVPFDHELVYKSLVAFQHRSRLFTLLPVNRYGHCDFTTDEILNAFGLMLQQAGGQSH